MEIKFYRTCHVKKDIAELYIDYCKENKIEFEASEDGSLVYISVYETKEKLDDMHKWILKTLKH